MWLHLFVINTKMESLFSLFLSLLSHCRFLSESALPHFEAHILMGSFHPCPFLGKQQVTLPRSLLLSTMFANLLQGSPRLAPRCLWACVSSWAQQLECWHPVASVVLFTSILWWYVSHMLFLLCLSFAQSLQSLENLSDPFIHSPVTSIFPHIRQHGLGFRDVASRARPPDSHSGSLFTVWPWANP